jgi:tetratricopeptide (TPR) repeat protein
VSDSALDRQHGQAPLPLSPFRGEWGEGREEGPERSAAHPGRQQHRPGSWVGQVLCFPLAALSAVLELVFSRRGLALLFLMLGGGLALVGWLRPPLSPDISGLHLPLGIEGTAQVGPEELLHGSPSIPPDSVGGLLLALTAVGLVLVLWRPALLGLAAGLVLAGALAAQATVACNHPELIALLESEREQRQHIAEVLDTLRGKEAVTNSRNGRISGSDNDSEAFSVPVDPLHAGIYLRYGWWLVAWASAGVLLGTRGPLSWRFGHLLTWLLVGGGLAGLACYPRLHAEYLWLRAQQLEARGADDDARATLAEAVTRFPAFDRLERTWLLAGKLDYRQKRRTPQERFFRATQLARNEEWAAALALLEDLLRVVGREHPAVQRQAARILTTAGLAHGNEPSFLPASRKPKEYLSHFGAVQARWRRALELAPRQRDAAFSLGAVLAFEDRQHPERAEAAFAPVLDRLADPFVHADILTLLGDAYFEAGKPIEARRLYARSVDVLNLPQQKNYLAQKGLGGL